MSLDILKMLIETACADGQLTEKEQQLLKEKATELGISEKYLSFMIDAELAKVQNNILPNLKEISHSNTLETEQILKSKPISEFSDLVLLPEIDPIYQFFKAKRNGKWVTIKRLKPEHQSNEQYILLLKAEFQYVASVSHENIVQVLDSGNDQIGDYYYMEYIDGQPLRNIIGKDGIGSEALIKKIALETLAALDYLHKKQIYHHNLSPDSILISYNGEHVKLSNILANKAIELNENLQSNKFLSPEQKIKANLIDARSDIYSFGLILSEMLSGQSTELNKAGIRSPEIVEIIRKCTENNPNNRYSDCATLAEHIKGIKIKEIGPEMKLSVSEIDLGKFAINEAKKFEIQIDNIGFGTLNWQAKTDCKQISLLQKDNLLLGDYKANKTGKYNEKIDIESNAGKATILLKIHTSSGSLKYILIGCVAVLVILFAFILKNVFKSDEELLWQNVKDQNSSKSYTEYLKKFPSGKYKTEAETQKNLIVNELKIWGEALTQNTLKGYEAYIQTYPTGKYFDDANWYSARRQNTKEAYQVYLTKFPQGKFVADCKSKMDNTGLSSGNLSIGTENSAPSPDVFIEDFFNDLSGDDWASAFKKTRSSQWKTADDLKNDPVLLNFLELKSTSRVNQVDDKATATVEFKTMVVGGAEKTQKQAISLRLVGSAWKITSIGKEEEE